MKTKIKLPLPNAMNSLEVKYAERLRIKQLAGEIHSYSFETHKLILAKGTTYTPDFQVIMTDGSIEFHETKGWMREDANVKIKVAAQLFPQYKFVLVVADKTIGWRFKTYPPHR